MAAQCIQLKNIQSFCRTCLAEIAMHSIAKGQKYNIHQTLDLAKWIIMCTPLEVKKNDGYPEFLCHECFQKLKSIFEFRQVCVQSMRFLANILAKNDNALTEPEVMYRTELFDDEDDTPLSMTIGYRKQRDAEEEERMNADRSSLKAGNDIDVSYIAKNDNALTEPEVMYRTELFDDEDDTPLSMTIGYRKQRDAEEEERMNADRSSLKAGNDIDIAYKLNYSQENIKIEVEEEKLLYDKTFEYKNCYDKSIIGLSQLANTESDYSSNEATEIYLESDYKSTGENLFMKMSTKKNTQTQKGQKDKDKKTVSKTVSSKNTTKFRCEVCPRRCMSEESLAAHLRVHKGLRPHPCNQCERSFNKWGRLNAHIRENHQDNVEEHRCSFEGCDKQFRRAETLIAHYRIKHKNMGAPTLNMCEECGRTFKNSTSFKEHRFKHRPSEEYPYQCAQCDKRYTSLRTFKEHQQRHAGIKNFVCPQCGMRKTTRKELRTHINCHTKDKLWPCPQCPSVFSRSANLARHDRVVHKGIRRYACRYCDQSFGKSDTLKHHEMRHTGEKPHECQLCGKRFIQIVALRAHVKTHNKAAASNSNKIVKQHQMQNKNQQKIFISEDEAKTACLTLVNDVNVD